MINSGGVLFVGYLNIWNIHNNDVDRLREYRQTFEKEWMILCRNRRYRKPLV